MDMPSPHRHRPALDALIVFYESITRTSVARIAELYSADAQFKDPFNEVSGTQAIMRIFDHMYEQVDAPAFRVRDAVLDGDQAFLTWDFSFAMRRGARARQTIRGATHLRFDAGGRVCLHRDYWDAAEELYEKLPILGGLMRWIKKAARA